MSRDQFLYAAVELFEETGEWPKLDWLQQAVWRDGTSVRREAKRLPRSLGDVEDDRLVLGVRAIHLADLSSPLLECFLVALRAAWARYRGTRPPTDVLLSISDLMNETSMSEVEAWQAMKLLAGEGLVKKSSGRVWAVLPAIRHYRGTRTVEAYLRRKRGFERRHWLRCAVTKPIRVGRKLWRPGGWVRAVALACLATLLAGFVLWVGKEVFASSPSHSPTPMPPTRSKAPPHQRERQSLRSAAARSGG